MTRYGEIEQARRDGVTAERQYTADVGRVSLSLDQGREHPRQLFGGGVKSRFAGRVEDGRAKSKADSNRRAPIEVACRHNSYDLASRVGNRQVLDACMQHVECGIRRIPIRPGAVREGGS